MHQEWNGRSDQRGMTLGFFRAWIQADYIKPTEHNPVMGNTTRNSPDVPLYASARPVHARRRRR